MEQEYKAQAGLNSSDNTLKRLDKTTLSSTILSPKSFKRSRGLKDWTVALKAKQIDFPWDLSRQTDENMCQRFQRLARNGLLRFPVASTRLDTFLKTPKKFLAKLKSQNLFIFVEAAKPALAYSRSYGKTTKQNATAFATVLAKKKSPSQLQITIIPFLVLKHNGTVTVQKNGEVYGEFTAGAASPTKGSAKIQYSFNRSPITQLISYSTKNIAIRSLLFRVLGAVPHFRRGRNSEYQPGYYEIGIIELPDCSDLKIIFFDYRTHPFFLGQRPTQTQTVKGNL